MDELSADERDKCAKYHSDVGYLPRGCVFVHRLHLSHSTLRQSEGPEAFSQFHLYVCSAFLVKWSDQLREKDFQVGRDPSYNVPYHNLPLRNIQGIIMFLQSLPTQDWRDHEIEMLLSEAFVLNSIWHNAQSHFGVK